MRQLTGSSTLRNSLLSALLLAAAIAVVHPELVFSSKIYGSEDAAAANAFAVQGRLAQARGELPLWNPFVFGGMPSYASLAFLPDVYPLQKPLRIVVEGLGLPPMSWMLLHLWIFALGTTLYLRWRGLRWTAAWMGGLACLVLPKVVAWGVHGHGTKLGTIAWLPWAIWSVEATLRRASRVAALLFSALLSLMLLRYHVQIFYYCAMALLIFGVALLVALRREPGLLPRTAWLALAGILAIGISMKVYLPVWEYQGESIRGAAEQGGGVAYDYATNWSLSPAELSTLLWPTAFGYGSGSYVGDMPFTDYPNYLGVPLLLLAIAALFWRRGANVYAWSALFLLSLLISFGKHGGLYDLFYNVAPFFKKFRVPSMILVMQQFALVMLAAEGLDALWDRWQSLSKSRRQMLLVGCGAIAVILLFLGTIGAESLRQNSIARWRELKPELPAAAFASVASMAASDALRLGSIFALAALALGLHAQTPAWRRHLPALLLLLPFWDLSAATSAIRHPEEHLLRPARTDAGIRWLAAPAMVREAPSETSDISSPLADWLLEQESRPRVWPVGVPLLAQRNDLAARGIVNLGGYHAAKLQRSELVRERIFQSNPPQVRLVNMMAARWVILGGPLPVETLDLLASLGMRLSPEPVFEGDEGVVYENLSALPRLRVVHAYELARGQDRLDLDRLTADDFDLSGRVLLDREPSVAPAPGADGSQVEVVDEGFDWLRIRAELDVPGLLVIADPYYPGWQATVDGEPRPLLRANVNLRAIGLSAGSHEVELRMAGGSYRTGRRIAGFSTGGMLLWLLALLALRWQARRA